MTDARLKGVWLNTPKFDELSDAAWRVFTGALMWSAQQGTDGLVPERYARLLHPHGDQPDAFDDIERAGLWVHVESGYQMVGWETDLGQSSAEQVDKYKKDAAARQSKYRESKAVKSVSETGDVTRDITRYVGTGLGIGISSVKEKLNSNSRPSSFCEDHPRGTTGSCRPCMNARLFLAQWVAENKSPEAQIRRLINNGKMFDAREPVEAEHADRTDQPDRRSAKECRKHPGYPDTTTSPCAACSRELANETAMSA